MAKVAVPAGMMQFIANQTATLTQRALRGGVRGGLDGPRRSVNEECQYPSEIGTDDYYEMWRREGYGKKVVETLPNECWLVDPDVYENEKKRFSAFEKAWKAHAEDPDIAPLSWLHQLDIRCGVGRFGALVIGLDDAADLSTPALAEAADGTLSAPAERSVQWLRAYDETGVRVAEVEGTPSHPRYGQPTYYEVVQNDMRIYANPTLTLGASGKWDRVHWTRVIHAADGAGPGEPLGPPRQQAVWNRLLDIRKILGGDGEMFWKAGFSGIALTVPPELLIAGTVEVDVEDLRRQVQLFMDGIQRYLSLVGVQADAIETAVSDPTAHVLVHLNAIACALDIPLRIFLGSEEAKVASGHDMKSWSRRVRRRQQNFCTPRLVRPYVDRMVALKVLPAPKVRDPKTKRYRYAVDWPTVDVPDDDQKSTVVDRMAAALQKYVQGGLHEIIQPSDFWRFIAKEEPSVVEEIMANIKTPPEIDFTPLNPPPVIGGPPGVGPPGAKKPRRGVKKGGDTGVAGDKPPSDPKPVTVR